MSKKEKPVKRPLPPIDRSEPSDTLSYDDRFLPNQTTFPFLVELEEDSLIREQFRRNENEVD